MFDSDIPAMTTNVPLVSPFASGGLIEFQLSDYPHIAKLIEAVKEDLTRRDIRTNVERFLCLYLCFPKNQELVLKEWGLDEKGKLKVLSVTKHNTSEPVYRCMKVVACHLLGHFADYWDEVIWAQAEEESGETIEPLIDVPLESDFLREYADLISPESLDITEEQ